MKTFYPEPLKTRVDTLETDSADYSSRIGTLEDTIENTVGALYQASGSHASFPAATSPTVIASLSLPAGVYVVVGHVNMSGVSNVESGTPRITEVRLQQGTSNLFSQRVYSTNAGAVNPTTVAGVFSLSSTTTINMSAFSTLAVSSSSAYRLRAVRIA